MKVFRSLFVCAALAASLALAVSVSGCGTGAGAADAAASTPASSHFKADLAAGYDAIQAVRIGTTSALQAHAITVDQAQAVQTQCKAFTATLDSLRAAGATSTSQSTLTATLLAINAATIFITASQGVPKS
jgi:hypothetical protein